MPKLVVLFGPRRGVVRELEGRFLIGRSGDADLQLVDEKVSREHCAFEPIASGIRLSDLGSRNGTWVNGERLAAPATLRPGDQVGVGDTVLLFDPTLQALHARGGEGTILLTETAATNVREGGAAPAQALEKAGELALRAALATEPDEAAALLCEAAQRLLRPASVALVVRGRAIATWPEGASLSVGRPLLELAQRQGRPVAMQEPQARAEGDAHTTRMHTRPGEVLCAPVVAGGEAIGALCVSRETPFEAADLTLAGALASAVGPALASLAKKPRMAAPPELPVAESASMREAMRQATAAARVPSTVLLTGESGTGKEEVARTIHALSPRASGPFIAVNCGAIPHELAESELFGHEKGAFTGALAAREGVFEAADGGTLFLDEIGDLPLTLQVKLLRALQERVVQRVGSRTPIPVDVRVVAATHRDLGTLVKEGTFREDLFWRLNVVPIHLAPLRERRDDVMPLAERLLTRIGARLGQRTDGFTGEARTALVACQWPGNVRQLANALERALVLRETTGPIRLSDLPAEVLASKNAGGSAGSVASGQTLGELVKALEREQIVLALKRAKGTKVAAAEALGISRPTLDRKIEEYRIDLFE